MLMDFGILGLITSPPYSGNCQHDMRNYQPNSISATFSFKTTFVQFPPNSKIKPRNAAFIPELFFNSVNLQLLMAHTSISGEQTVCSP